MCHALEASESGYYAWKRRGPSRRSQEDALLAGRIEQIFHDSRQTYGSPRIQAELRDQGRPCSRKQIARLMHQRGLSARRRHRRTCTTDSHSSLPKAPNRLNRTFDFRAAEREMGGGHHRGLDQPGLAVSSGGTRYFLTERGWVDNGSQARR